MAHKHSAQLESDVPERRRGSARIPRRQRASEPGVWRRRVRRVLVWAGAAASVAGVVAGAYAIDEFLANDARFALPQRGLAIEGTVHMPRASLQAVFARDFGRSVYRVPLAERRASLLRIDWVKDATVSRQWPNRIAVRIVERTPVAFLVAPGGAPALIDAEGLVLSLPPRAKLDLPALTGITREQTREARRERVSNAMELLRDAGSWAGRISEIDAGDANNIKLTFLEQGRAYRLWMGNRNYRARLENFLKFRTEINRRLPYATIFDLRLDDRITVPAEGNHVPPAKPAPTVAKARSGRRRAR